MGEAVTRLGRYTLVRSLGAGGMAELFLARADGIGGFAKLVALKRILGHKASNEKFIRMLVNEARLVATLDHPNIAQVYDIGVEAGEYFFAMEYVHGQDLRHVLHAAPGHQLQLENALHVATGVCAGLHHAHEARDPDGRPAEIVHRDVSPSNILISYQGAVKLVDFGVAKAASVVSETREGIIKGKYGYMSPEQCLGQPLDRRSDIFAVGILLWEMTVGRRLYKVKGDLVTLQRVVYVDAPRPSRFVENYPPALERIVMRALARDPAQRYETAEQIQIELEQFAVDHRLAISPVSMAMEMRALFRQRVDAWQDAQQRGRSLADHLAEISSEDALPSSNDDDDVLDAVLDGLEGSVVTAVQRPTPSARYEAVPGALATTTPAPTATTTAAPRRRGLLVALLALVALAAAGVAVWAVVFRVPPAEAPVAAPAIGPGAAPDATRLATVEPDAAEAIAPPPAPDAPPEPDLDELEVVEIDAAPEPIDAAEPDRKPRKRPGHRVAKVIEKQAPDDDPPRPPPPDAAPVAQPPRPPTPPDAAVAPAGPKPGTVDATEVRAVVRAHRGELAACVDRARMENRDLAGRVTLRIDLAPTGKVTRVRVASSTGATTALESCMSKVVAGWTFPAPAGNVAAAITYPFAF